MFVDSQTRKDLEILRARDRGASVLGLLDHTRTGPGARALRARMSAPTSDPTRLSESFEAIRALAESGLEFTIRGEVVRAVEAYLDSNFDTVRRRSEPRRTVEAWILRVRHRDLVRHAMEGRTAVASLAVATVRLVDRVRSHAPPAGLTRLLDELATIAAELDLTSGASPRSLRVVLAADHTLRSERRDDLVRFVDAVGELDALFSAASLLDRDYVLPELNPSPELHVGGSGIWHPFLSQPVANPLALEGGETLIFLTGPNMAGKTTYLKAVGICVYLAHCGLPVPAGRLAFTPLDGLFTSLSPEDNVREGLSYFMAEVRRVREVVEFLADGGRTLAIFDEVFRGTNVRDALEASRTVITGCARAPHGAFVFSSHLVELARDLSELGGVRFLCFDGDIAAGEPTFDYELKSGVSEKRFGLELLRQEGVPDLLEALGR